MFMKELIISPSILSLDYQDTAGQLRELEESNAKWMHFDVMDGHFVPNLTFGPDILKAFKASTTMLMDVHIMVEQPEIISEIFIKAGADLVTFHLEAVENLEACIALCRKIRAAGVQAGVSVKPKTPVDALLPHLAEMDLVLIMSVEPGFGGQSFMEEMLEKVHALRTVIEEQQLSTRIEIDGGINAETGRLAVEAGCDTLVAGSYLFKSDIKQAVDRLLACQK